MYRLRILAAKKNPWNKGKLIGPKQPLSLKQIWSIRHSLKIEERFRDLALFDLAIDSKLRACDLLSLRVSDVSSNGRVNRRATVLQQKTQSPVRFEITSGSRRSIEAWIDAARLSDMGFLFPSRQQSSQHLSLRQYSRILVKWVSRAVLDPTMYGTHSMRRTKATLIYRQTKNIRAVQLLLGHSKLESTVRYLGVDVDDALEISEQIDL
jgi:integrase